MGEPKAVAMLLLRLSFLCPAIADFVLAALTAVRMAGVRDDSLLPRAEFAGAAFCWGVFLIIGMQKPMERAWILLPTAMVIGCIGLAFALGFMTATVSPARASLAVALSAALSGLCLAGLGYARARDPTRSGR